MVACLSKASITVIDNNARSEGLGDLRRAVFAGVVDNDDIASLGYAFQAARKHPFAIECHDNKAN